MVPTKTMSLETTYRILAVSTRPESVDVLASGIAGGDAETRQRCFRTLAIRPCHRSHELLIENWTKYRDEIVEATTTHRERFAATVVTELETELIHGKTADAEAGIERAKVLTQIVSALAIREAMPQLIDAAWKNTSHVVREYCVDTVLVLSNTWGKHARRQYAGQRTDPNVERSRLALTAHLLDCAKNFQKHRNEQLLDAFLVLSTWNDPALRSCLENESPCRTLILRRLRSSRLQAVMELLAGFIRRRTIPECVLGLMLQRCDAMYCETLLEVISPEPLPVTLANLKEFGLPDCLRGGVSLLRTLGTDRDSAIAHAYTMAMQHAPETIAVLLEILERHRVPTANSEHACDSVSICLSRCEVPKLDYWLQAVHSERIDAMLQPSADENPNTASGAVASDETTADTTDAAQGFSLSESFEDRAAEVCLRLIRWAQSSNARFAKPAKRLLGELNINNMLPLFPTLSTDVRLRIGRMLMQIDSSTLDVVRDGLRHAVMRRRLEAIEFAQTLGLVELMIEPFKMIVHTDHQRARLAAAEALGTATCDSSANLLKELTTSPLGSLRDAAKESLSRRGIAV
ncbi:hypothetical protein [Aporhodopirellula aestuarii]|uniref:HEAT repeat domain-containing protein n=1 Tax=Aporhodopirellula aestuarii TaxID=2950107 RepID=A0ABT0U5Q0_9BACT|nr:hypothetical protein [Aporhodopirellula aestuarii]MCM2372245.1 hypothetical protein [Aporhodopirellula aestuarii]